jgi:hypothetical protein
VLQLMAETGRLCRKDDFTPLLLRTARPATVSWRRAATGGNSPMLVPEPAASLVIPLQTPWFVDLERHLLGPLQVPAIRPSLPACSRCRRCRQRRQHWSAKRSANRRGTCPATPNRPAPAAQHRRRAGAAVAAGTLQTHGNRGWREYLASYGGGLFDVALPVFRYADVEVIPDDSRDFSIWPAARWSASSVGVRSKSN